MRAETRIVEPEISSFPRQPTPDATIEKLSETCFLLGPPQATYLEHPTSSESGDLVLQIKGVSILRQ
jgi:hypothetical protein